MLRLLSNDEEGIRRLNKVRINCCVKCVATLSPRQRLSREVHVWKRLKHPNIVPLYGTTSDFGLSFSTGMVSPWMHNGDLITFLRKTGFKLSVSDRFQIVRAAHAILHRIHTDTISGKQLRDIVSGLIYRE